MQQNTKSGVAIVTGAGGGIGYATAEAFAKSGYSVAVVDISEHTALAAAADISNNTGAQAIGQTADVTDIKASAMAYENIKTHLGTPTVLVNNAGTVVKKKARLEDVPQADIDDLMAVHVGGTLNWSRLVLPDMRHAGFGRIINISSVNAIAAVPYRIAYVTAKKAIRGVTEALAVETARAGITVNAIAPGYVLTDMLKKRVEDGILEERAIAERTPVGRWGTPKEIAAAAIFLASENASFVTGTTLVVDGGYSIRGDAGEDLVDAPA